MYSYNIMSLMLKSVFFLCIAVRHESGEEVVRLKFDRGEGLPLFLIYFQSSVTVIFFGLLFYKGIKMHTNKLKKSHIIFKLK